MGPHLIQILSWLGTKISSLNLGTFRIFSFRSLPAPTWLSQIIIPLHKSSLLSRPQKALHLKVCSSFSILWEFLPVVFVERTKGRILSLIEREGERERDSLQEKLGPCSLIRLIEDLSVGKLLTDSIQPMPQELSRNRWHHQQSKGKWVIAASFHLPREQHEHPLPKHTHGWTSMVSSCWTGILLPGDKLLKWIPAFRAGSSQGLYYFML